MNSYFLGIDTGGTFTDGVLLEAASQRVVKTAKVLTTHHDLRECIREMIDCLLPEERESIRMVSLSTTLATNAIVEGKSRPVGLFLLGYDPQLVYQYGFEKQFGTEHFFFIPGGMDLQGHEQQPLDEAALREKIGEVGAAVEAWAVSSYGGALNTSHEEAAAELIAGQTGLPVVEGGQLSGRLDSIRRATTARLNASLLSTAYDFLHTVQAMLTERGVRCPLIVVRGDGSLVSAPFASRRPVEIIHSGPATSAIGGLHLAGVSDGLVIDIGGTTTDLALLRGGQLVLEGGEATVGGYRTSVRTIRARSFGLGGDSQVRFDPHGRLSVGPSRVMPLAYLAHAHPEAARELEGWLMGAPRGGFYSDKLEVWILRREPKQLFKDPRTNRVIELLRGGPKRLAWLLKQAGAVSARQVDADLLIQQDIIFRAGLTPTDLLHASGEYTPWDTRLPLAAIDAAARAQGIGAEEWAGRVRDRMTEMITGEIVHFLSGRAVPEPSDTLRSGSLARWLFDEALSGADPALGCELRMKMPLIGIGAPARAFLTPVARVLHTEILFPEHYQVANAVGTVVGNILVRKVAEVVPVISGTTRTGYRAAAGGEQREFADRDPAIAWARQKIEAETLAEAQAAGAAANGPARPRVELAEQALAGDITLITATAAGKPGVEQERDA